MAKPTDEETTEVETPEVKEEVETPAEEDDFDKARAMDTIKKLRAIEKEHKSLLKEKEDAAAAEAEAQKSLETKLAEAQERIGELESKETKAAIRADFIAKAQARGYGDLELAFLAAEAQGVLGTKDPKTGVVGDHDFEALEAKFPLLAGEAEEERGFGSGDAGVRGKRPKATAASGFNDSIRGAIRGS